MDQRGQESSMSRLKVKIIKCCGADLHCASFTNTCPYCEADYNWAGQRLAHRSQWGEETGEHPADLVGPFTGDELDDGW